MQKHEDIEYTSYGGVGRVKLLVLALASTLAQVILLAVGFFISSLFGANSKEMGIGMSLYMAVIVIATLIFNLYLLYQRNKNLGINPWVGLILCFVPIINIVWGIIVYIGQEGFWEEKRLDGPGKVWLSIFAVLLAITIATVAIKLPEIKKLKDRIDNEGVQTKQGIFGKEQYPTIEPIQSRKSLQSLQSLDSKNIPTYGLDPSTQDFNKTTKNLNKIIEVLESGKAEDSKTILTEIAKNQGSLNPLVIGLATNLMLQKGQVEKGLFWFYAGELRTLSDLNLYKDKTIPSAFLKQYLGEELKGGRVSALGPSARTRVELFIKENPEIAKTQLSKALAWDKKTSKSYDRLWLGKIGAIPQHQWQSQDNKTRDKFAQSELISIGVGEIGSVFKKSP